MHSASLPVKNQLLFFDVEAWEAHLTRSLDLSRVRRHFQKMSGRQTDTNFVSKALLKRLFTPPNFFSAIQSHQKRDKKP